VGKGEGGKGRYLVVWLEERVGGRLDIGGKAMGLGNSVCCFLVLIHRGSHICIVSSVFRHPNMLGFLLYRARGALLVFWLHLAGWGPHWVGGVTKPGEFVEA
jgi:hypothetical protein